MLKSPHRLTDRPRQHDPMLQLVIFLGRLYKLDTGLILQDGERPRKLETKVGFSRTIDASTQESSNLHELVNSRRSNHRSATPADWCAVWAVARCELGLLLVLHTAEARARVFW